MSNAKHFLRVLSPATDGRDAAGTAVLVYSSFDHVGVAYRSPGYWDNGNVSAVDLARVARAAFKGDSGKLVKIEDGLYGVEFN